MISFGRHICNDFNVAIEKEWLLTNRKGSYSSSTILLTNTRKYHGLLVAKLPGMDNRVVIFPNCDEEVSMSGHIHNISTHKYRETVYPKGYSYLENFSVKNDIVEFLFLVENMRLKKEIFLMKESNSLVITYTVLTPNSHASITVKPFIAFREAEHLVKEIPVFFPEITVISERKLRISAYSNFPPGYIYIPEGSEAKMEGVWYRDFYYLREAQSGYDASEDLYNAGIIKFDIEYNKPRIMVFSLEDFPEEKVTGLRDEYDRQFKRVDEICEEKGVCIRQDESRNNIRHLIAAAESFEIRADDGSVFVAAGYMWPHLMWYRDALASLPGIFLVLKKYAEAKELLITGLSMAGKGL
ncbi:MAG TPA: glycogen debranching enzyme N-terminal domain-containing protein, partial [Candidatus Goldiibacteriota bacterium]|nr:glycogen debranching enzyme N-terminal domain-containing protein [Candidatus Goldiibacteriota bacterium]